jgi:hypothetical protein
MAIQGSRVKVYFRDAVAVDPERAVRELDSRYVNLEVAPQQSDPLLDNLPPYDGQRFERPSSNRLTLAEGIEMFRAAFPLLFDDPAYIGDLKTGERAYKWAAHEQFERLLSREEFERLLSAGSVEELRSRALSVEGRVNLLAVFEKAAFRDGLADDIAAERYFRELHELLAAEDPDGDRVERYFNAVESLPHESGKTTPGKWTVATILPFLAQPNRFMFLKPQVTQECASRLTFDLNYRADLNWLTFMKLLEMSRVLLDTLRPFGARDFIDIQSFIWLIGAGLKDE